MLTPLDKDKRTVGQDDDEEHKMRAIVGKLGSPSRRISGLYSRGGSFMVSQREQKESEGEVMQIDFECL